MIHLLIAAALLVLMAAGCASPREFPGNTSSKQLGIYNANPAATNQAFIDRTGPPPMPPSLTPAVQMAISKERQRQINKHRPLTPHLLMQPGDTNRFVGPPSPSKL